MPPNLKDEIRKFALLNAVQHEGKASKGAVVGNVMGHVPDAKKDIKETMILIEKTVSEVNSMTPEAQKKEIDALGVSTEEEKKEKELLKDLPDVDTKKGVVMRFAPNPNGPLSFGHSRQALLNWFYVKKYGGKYILRLDDTDPKVKTPIKEAYEWIVKDLAWLGIRPDTIVKASDRFDIYYDHALNLIKVGAAYVCTCPADEFSEKKKNAIACPCRDLPPKEHVTRWENMFTSYKEGEAVVRIKTDIKHKNPALRDWPALRIVDNPHHPIVNYKVWPLYDFASAIDDHLLGITHIIRGIDFLATRHKQGYLYDYFKWKYPVDIVTGKLIVEGIKSTTESRKLIEEGKLTGWDDVRLGTLMALRKRGFSPQAIINFITDVGVKKSDVAVSEKNLYAYNRKIIDSTSPRFFFTEDPVQIDVSRAKSANTSVTVKSPIDFQKDRTINVGTAVYVAKKDYDKYKGKNVRLKEFAYGNLEKTFMPAGDEDKYREIQIIQWVPEKDSVDVEITMPDNSVIRGKAEKNISGLNNTIVQFERVGFVNLFSDSKKITGYFAHP